MLRSAGILTALLGVVGLSLVPDELVKAGRARHRIPAPCACPPHSSNTISELCCALSLSDSSVTTAQQHRNHIGTGSAPSQHGGCHHPHGGGRHELTEPQRETLLETLHFIEELQRFPNSSRARPTRQTWPVPVCDRRHRYRTTDGTCNRSDRPSRGAAGQALMRLMPATYQDHVFLPRFLDSAGAPLPTPRHVSLAVTSARDTLLTRLTDSVMQWGQFIDHDLSLSPPVELASPCCRRGVVARDAHPFCLPIAAAADDPVYSRCATSCIEFTRSVPAWDERTRSMSQLNVRTSFIDVDMIYGVGDRWAARLRARFGGTLQVNGVGLLLPDPDPMMCFSAHDSEPCFRSGDIRVNEQVRLSVMHTIWMREHNRIARRLEELNPHWGDERLFQEARRIVIAEVQHITYSAWLPIVLGTRFMKAYMIDQPPDATGYSTRYNGNVDSTIATEFSSAAFRFGHSLVNEEIYLFSNVRSGPFGFTALRDIFFNPKFLYHNSLGLLAKSLIMQAPQRCDTNFASSLTGHLFQEHGSACGLDLVAINIQRGRDHGVANYTGARRWCGLPPAGSFAQLVRHLPTPVVIRLAGAYRSVDDIDLFIGGVSETPAPGAVVGPTFQCIVGNQFFRLRWGDNFFYDLGGGGRPWRFGAAQLEQLRRVSWARVLCDNVDTISVVQPDAFLAQSETNKLTPCDEIPAIDLGFWRSDT